MSTLTGPVKKFIETITPHFAKFEEPGMAVNRCSDVCEAIRVLAKKYDVPIKIGSVEIVSCPPIGYGHNLLYTKSEHENILIDYTLSQFTFFRPFAHPMPFPLVVELGTPKCNLYYKSFRDCDNDWDWDDELASEFVPAQEALEKRWKEKHAPRKR